MPMITEVEMSKYLSKIMSDYENFNCAPDSIRNGMIKRFYEGLDYKEGSKYIKVMTGGSVHSFIVNTDNDPKFRKGDILKAASWSAPARNFARGNVFEEYEVRWTGA